MLCDIYMLLFLQRDVIDPAVQGTLNVLKACIKSPTVRRVVHTSSAAAIRFTGKDVPDTVFDESCWTDVEFVTKNKIPGWVSSQMRCFFRNLMHIWLWVYKVFILNFMYDLGQRV